MITKVSARAAPYRRARSLRIGSVRRPNRELSAYQKRGIQRDAGRSGGYDVDQSAEYSYTHETKPPGDLGEPFIMGAQLSSNWNVLAMALRLWRRKETVR
jgi:hypothetical protein